MTAAEDLRGVEGWCRACGEVVRLEGSDFHLRDQPFTYTDTGSEHHPECDGDNCSQLCPVPVPVPREGVMPQPCGPAVEGHWIERWDALLFVDLSTGELLDAREGEKDRFTVDSRDKAEWVLRLKFEAAQETAAKRARLKLLVENAQKEIARLEQREKGLARRFDGDLEAWVRRDREGQKTRSVQTPYGVVGLRKVPEAFELHEDAAEWAKRTFEGTPAVEPRPVLLVSKLSEEQRRQLLELGLARVVVAHDTFYVK